MKKAIKNNSVKMLVNFSFIILLLLSSCAQSGNNNKAQSENNATTSSKVEKPNVDIHTAVLSGNLEAVRQPHKSGY